LEEKILRLNKWDGKIKEIINKKKKAAYRKWLTTKKLKMKFSVKL
jgi:hypothetical protein